MNPKLFLLRSKIFGIRQLVKTLFPVTIDDLLYIGEELPHMHRQDISSLYSVKRFSMEHLSGVKRIDSRLTPYNLAYVVCESDEIVHESWVCFDTLLPSQYGFDSDLPVIGHSFTTPRYRGAGIYSYMLNYVLNDLKARNISINAYVLVSSTNKTSIRGIERAGFRRLALLKGTRVLGCLIFNKSTLRFGKV
jgi:GNAT superfamily N-acetyltransferase